MQLPQADSLERYLKLLVITLDRGGYPHEVIACMFNKLFDTRGRPAGLEAGKEWPPARIVEQKSDRRLWQVAQDLEIDYSAAASLPPELVSACFQLLHRRMVCHLEQIIKPKDQTARKRWAGLRHRLVGETTLADYYGRHPEADIANWSYKVLQTVKRIIVTEKWLQRPYEDLLRHTAVPLGC